jgi:SWI/SNF-related matrix-associated actin-dependent regulator 1 of chromatin subfamily A
MATTVNFDSYLPDGQHLLPFQHVGVAYSIFQTNDGKGCLIGDEQGLGKTAQAIVTTKVHAAAHSLDPKVLIVVKASIKANWAKEIARFAPEWDVQVLNGTRPYELTAKVAIISFNLLSKWADALVAEGFTSLIVDESHNVKDPKAQQTKAALKIAADVRSRKGLVLLLTGTPILNRPVELVTQLQMMGRLEDIAPRPRAAQPTERDYAYSFMFTFCDPKNNGHGWEFKGASRLDLLNNKARNEFLIRRLRNEVLDMSETHRVQVDLSLNGDLDPYWDVEKNFVAKNDQSFMLELLNALRLSVSQCKIPAAVDWITDFLADNPGKKLVVWADHVATQQGITDALNAAGIEAIYLKGAKDIEVAKARFNEGSAQVIVCSLKAHGFGHTLVGNGHNVTDCLFVESPWHPGAVTQAEDRINRIGRQAEAVFAHTLVVPGTVDVWLADLIAAKWDTFKAAIDGTIAEGEVADIQKVMMDRLAAHLLSKYGEGRFPQGEEGTI